MSDKRSPIVIAAALAALVATSNAQCVPLNLHTSVELLSEFAESVAEQAPAEAAQSLVEAVAALAARVDHLNALLVQAGVIPEPAAAEQGTAQADTPAA